MSFAEPSFAIEQDLKMPDLNVSQELVSLIRGFFATPVITALGRLDLLNIALSHSEFNEKHFTKVTNKKLLADSLDYLNRIALLEKNESQKYRLTEVGKKIFQRLSSFLAPHSYGDYMRFFYEQLSGPADFHKPQVDRLENILGSGRTHERYFPVAVSYLRRKLQGEWIADIGCGDGRFLDFALRSTPGLNAMGIDLSEISVQTAGENLVKTFPDRQIKTFACNAQDVPAWSEFVRRTAGDKRVVISMWFLLHEISQRKPENVIQFLGEVRRLFPQSPLIIGELVRQKAEWLSGHRHEMLMAEYLLFHDMSNQGVLSWDEYQQVLKSIPYDLAMQRTFDEIGPSQETKEPATFVWCLTPK